MIAVSSHYYRVIVNDSGCYCIWPHDIAVPPGWTSTGFSSTGETALRQIAELWGVKTARYRSGPSATDT